MTLHKCFVLCIRMTFSNLKSPPEQCAILRTFCFYFFSYPDSLLPHLRIVAILSASRRSRRVTFSVRYVINKRCNVLAFSTQVRGFKPGRSRRIFRGEKIFSTPSFGEEVKPSVPCRRFAACKRSLMA